MEQLLANWKHLISHAKKNWTARDYPIRIREQARDKPGVPRYCAQIINWWQASGLGETKDEAVANLQVFLDNYRKERGRLPRPGLKVPIEFAPADGVRRHAKVAGDFIVRVLGFSPDAPIFISDASSLHDFAEDSAALDAKVKEIYGVDVSDLPDRNLVKIFARIAATR